MAPAAQVNGIGRRADDDHLAGVGGTAQLQACLQLESHCGPSLLWSVSFLAVPVMPGRMQNPILPPPCTPEPKERPRAPASAARHPPEVHLCGGTRGIRRPYEMARTFRAS